MIASIDLHRINQLTIKYADLPMDFADACYFWRKNNISTVATIETGFDVYRLKGNNPFTTLIKLHDYELTTG